MRGARARGRGALAERFAHGRGAPPGRVGATTLAAAAGLAPAGRSEQRGKRHWAARSGPLARDPPRAQPEEARPAEPASEEHHTRTGCPPRPGATPRRHTPRARAPARPRGAASPAERHRARESTRSRG